MSIYIVYIFIIYKEICKRRNTTWCVNCMDDSKSGIWFLIIDKKLEHDFRNSSSFSENLRRQFMDMFFKPQFQRIFKKKVLSRVDYPSRTISKLQNGKTVIILRGKSVDKINDFLFWIIFKPVNRHIKWIGIRLTRTLYTRKIKCQVNFWKKRKLNFKITLKITGHNYSILFWKGKKKILLPGIIFPRRSFSTWTQIWKN